MASIAIVYIGERRFDGMAASNHQRLFDALAQRHQYQIYDVTHAYRTWSVEGLCGEQAQILDMHHALSQVSEDFVIKIRTDAWICPWEIDKVLDNIDRVVNDGLDFAFMGPRLNFESEVEHYDYVIPQHPWTHDVLICFRKSNAKNVPELLQNFPDQNLYTLNKGWWLFATEGSRCNNHHMDIYIIRQALDTPTDYQVVEDWFTQAISVMEGTSAEERNTQLREEWRARHGRMG